MATAVRRELNTDSELHATRNTQHELYRQQNPSLAIFVEASPFVKMPVKETELEFDAYDLKAEGWHRFNTDLRQCLGNHSDKSAST